MLFYITLCFSLFFPIMGACFKPYLLTDKLRFTAVKANLGGYGVSP